MLYSEGMETRLALVLSLAVGCGDNQPGPDAGTSSPLHFASCRTPPLECATLVVPADWSRPDGPTIALPVVRAPARDPSRRLGALTFNFGGPGEATLDSLANRYPHQPIASTIALADRFDFVFMDWRGVATTRPALSCLDASTTPRVAAERFAPKLDAEWTALFQLVGDVAAGCAARADNAPLLAHMDTESAARDFDALRAGLGEDKLDMWVVSYGTRLGAMYAELFPDRVRAIVLDSPVAPVTRFEDFLTGQNAAFEAELARFFAWCGRAAPATCPFRTSDGNAATIAAAFEALLATADATPVVAQGVTLDRATIDLVATNMMYFPSYEWPRLGAALAALAGGDGARMAQLVASGLIDYGNDDNAFSSYQNVIAQDYPLPAAIATPAGYRQWAESVAAAAPHVALQNIAAQAFAVAWPTTAPSQHAIGATTAPPLLLTATRNDPATPYAGAIALQQALANGSYVVTYEGDGHASGEFQPCIGEVTAAFLIDPTAPPATLDCAVVEPAVAPRALPPLHPHHVGRPWQAATGAARLP